MQRTGEAEKKCLTARGRSLLSPTKQAKSRTIEASGQPGGFVKNAMYSVRQKMKDKMKDKKAAYIMGLYMNWAREHDSARQTTDDGGE